MVPLEFAVLVVPPGIGGSLFGPLSHSNCHFYDLCLLLKFNVVFGHLLIEVSIRLPSIGQEGIHTNLITSAEHHTTMLDINKYT